MKASRDQRFRHAQFLRLAVDLNDIPSKYRNFRAREYPLLLGINSDWGRDNPMRFRRVEELTLENMIGFLKMGAVLGDSQSVSQNSDEL
eukprot:scaffold790_cov387-Prasinococcus_capsulatus_cf.AAC.9